MIRERFMFPLGKREVVNTFLFIFVLSLLSCTKSPRIEPLEQIHRDGDIIGYTFKEGGKYGLLDDDFAVLLEPRFDYIYGYEEFGTIKVDSGGEHINGGDYIGYDSEHLGLIDITGKILVNPQYEQIVFGKGGIARVKKNGLYGYLDKAGREMIKPSFDSASLVYDDVAPVVEKGVWGIIRMTGNYVFRDSSVHYISEFNDGIAYFFDETRHYGYINSQGNIILDGYDGAGSFQYGYGPIYRQGLGWGVIDGLGTVVVSPSFNSSIRIIESDGEVWLSDYDDEENEWVRRIKLKSI
jgi:hypothetical protein